MGEAEEAGDADESYSIAEICKSVGASRAALYRYLKMPPKSDDLSNGH